MSTRRCPATHTIPEGAATVAGAHVFPLGEPYAITLMVVARVAGETPTEVETRRRLLDSLREGSAQRSDGLMR
jgi:hypothetical protein